MYGVSSRLLLDSKGVKNVKTSKNGVRKMCAGAILLVIKWAGSVGFGRLLAHIEDLDEI